MNILEIEPQADNAAVLLKAMGHSRRLMILCHLLAGEKSAGALERLVGLRQSALSQHLAKLRGDGLVRARREGQSVYYALADNGPREVIEVLHDVYCGRNSHGRSRPTNR